MTTSSSSPTARSARDFVDPLIAAVEQRDADAFAALMAPDVVGHHPFHPEPVRGRDAVREGEQALFDAFSDISVTVRSVLADERRCAVEVVINATNSGELQMADGGTVPATGRSIAVPATWWYELGVDGLIAGTRDYFDTGTFMAQMGLDRT